MDLGIKGRTAIVCASSKGLGKACAAALAEAGCDVVINGRDEKILAATAKELAAYDTKITPVAADVGTEAGRAALLAACPEPDILVNNNGGPPFQDLQSITEADIMNGIRGNMVTPILLLQKVLDKMVERKFGRIINITSASVKMPLAGLAVSSGARAGLTAFVASLVKGLAPHNVTINSILPGAFDTDRVRKGSSAAAEKRGISVDAVIGERVATIPAGRLGQPEEFGQLCAFLASVHGGYITGQNLLIDGGVFDSNF
jgi:3-oxoacyl-[acyl-carrier protein] reductase